MTATTQAPYIEKEIEKEGINPRNVIYPISFGFLILVFYVSSLVKSLEMGESPCVPILFFLPVIPSICGLVKLYRHHNIVFYRFYLLASTSAMVGYCGLWFSYCFFGRSWRPLSWLALGWILWLVVLVIIMTQALIKRPDGNGRKPGEENLATKTTFSTHLRTKVAEDPSWAIVMFFTVFISLAYLFGFALGFYDQYALEKSKGKKPALHMANVDSIDDPEPDAQKPATEEAKKPLGSGTQPQLTPITSTPFHYHFTKGSARLSNTLAVIPNPPQHPPLLTDPYCRPDVCNTV